MGQKTVLVVDDEVFVREVLRDHLRKRGYRVLVAAKGEGALATVEKHAGEIHLLVCDLVMPGISGPQVVEQLTAARPGLKVLLYQAQRRRFCSAKACLFPANYSS